MHYELLIILPITDIVFLTYLMAVWLTASLSRGLFVDDDLEHVM